MRRSVKRVLWIAGAAVLAVLILAAGATVYLARNPDRLQGLIVNAASSATGLDIHFQDLSWTLEPLRVRVRGVTAVSPKEASQGKLHAAVGSVGADLAFEGGFGDRVLVVKRVSVKDVDISVQGIPALPLPGKDSGPFSGIARAASGLVRYLVVQGIRVEKADLAQARVHLQTPAGSLRVSDLSARRAPGGTIDLSCGLQMHHPESDLQMDLPGIHAEATPGDAEAAIPWRVHISEGTLTRGDLRVKGLSFEAKGSIEPEDRTVHIHSLDLGLPDARPLIPVALGGPLEARLHTGGTIRPDQGRFEMEEVTADLYAPSAGIQVKAGVTGAWTPSLQGSLHGLSCRLRPEEWLPLLPEEIRAPLAGVRFQGDVSLSGGLSVAAQEGSMILQPDLSLAFHDNHAAFHAPSIEAGGRISGSLHAGGAWPDLSVSGTIRAAGLALDGPNFSLGDAAAKVRVEGGMKALRVRDAAIEAPAVHVGPSSRSLTFQELRVRIGDARFETESRSLTCPKVHVEARGLGPFQVKAKAVGGEANVTMEGEETGLLALISGQGFPLAGWGLKGRDRIRVRVRRERSGALAVSSRIGLDDLAFEHAGLGMFGEGLSLDLKAEGTVAAGPEPDMIASASFEVPAGELLLDRFYLNAGSHAVSLKTRVRSDSAFETVEISAMEGALGGLLSAKVSGTLERLSKGLRASLSLSVPPFALKPAFQLFVVEPFKTAAPLLESMDVEGTASADLRLDSGPAGFSVFGDAQVREGSVSADEAGFALQGVELSMPLWYETAPAGGEDPVPREGRLRVGSLQVPVLPEQALSATFSALPNRIRVPGPTVLKIPGGDLRIDALEVEYDPKEGFRAETAASLDNVAMEPMLSKVWSDPPQGSVHGTLPSVQYRRGTLSTNGHLEAKVFEGKIVLDHLGASGLFTSAPVFRMDARWEDLNLEPMTQGTAFGRITGILEGHLKGFQLAYGQPQAFDLLLETVPRKGVPQRISVTAVDNISRIGGGGSPFIGMAGFLTSLFRDFPYERIGVHAVLENDVFRINGTIRDGGTEYLVKRGGFSGVNVVNQNPDNRIRFKDMVKRIQRVTASRGGPVIK